MSLLNNRSSMVLFQNEMGHRSQKIRMVLSEKGIACDFESLNPDDIPSEILEVNPSGNLPLLIDRELSLYHSGLIVEYLDENIRMFELTMQMFKMVLLLGLMALLSILVLE